MKLKLRASSGSLVKSEAALRVHRAVAVATPVIHTLALYLTPGEVVTVLLGCTGTHVTCSPLQAARQAQVDPLLHLGHLEGSSVGAAVVFIVVCFYNLMYIFLFPFQFILNYSASLIAC